MTETPSPSRLVGYARVSTYGQTLNVVMRLFFLLRHLTYGSVSVLLPFRRLMIFAGVPDMRLFVRPLSIFLLRLVQPFRARLIFSIIRYYA
jgi:hypothetical protein